MANMIIDFGKKYKGHQISECDEKYLKWLVSHEKVLAMRNRWASRDARFELQRRAQAAIEAAIALKVVTRTPEWSYARFCYVWSDTGEIAADEDKPKYRILGSFKRKERFDLVDHITKKAEDKRRLLAECREIQERAKKDVGLRGNLNRETFSISR